MRITRGLGVAAVIVALLGTASVFGANIVSIGALAPFGTDAAASKIYAISADGKYAVGESQGQNVAGTSTLGQAVIWSTGSGLVQLPNNPAPAPEMATSARGVVVKANGEIGVAAYMNDPGFTPYRMNHYTASPGALGSGTYLLSPGSHNLNIGTYNAARNYDDGTGNEWSIAGQKQNGQRGIISTTSGFSDSNSNGGHMFNVTSRVPRGSAGTNRGYAAGYIYGGGASGHPNRALFAIGGVGVTILPGSAGWQSEALGMSPKTTDVANSGVIVGYDQDTTTHNYKHGFYYPQGAAGMTLLAELSGDVQSEAIDVRVIGGNRIIGGYSSNGTTETAVLWDSTGIWDATGQPVALSTLVNMAGWSSLSRITSMSDDGTTVAGWGVLTNGETRGFVATVPEPATLVLLTLGGLSFLRRNRH